jgi:transposase
MLQPVIRRTWAPRGQTPIHRSWDRHDRFSVISALTVSPRRRRIHLYFAIHEGNIREPEATRFIRALRRQVGGRLLLVWDRLNVHRSSAKKLGGIPIEWLPPYAPDANPVEQVWNHAKHATLANHIPANVFELRLGIGVALTLQQEQQALLRSFFQHARLFL